MQTNELAANQVKGDFVFLRADGLKLLFPLDDVAHTAYLGKETNTPIGSSHLVMDTAKENDITNDLAISETLQLLPELPKDRFILVQMKGIDVRLCWSEMSIMTNRQLTVEWIPLQFLQEGAPLRALVMIDEQPVFFCDTAVFLAYLFPKKF